MFCFHDIAEAMTYFNHLLRDCFLKVDFVYYLVRLTEEMTLVVVSYPLVILFGCHLEFSFSEVLYLEIQTFWK